MIPACRERIPVLLLLVTFLWAAPGGAGMLDIGTCSDALDATTGLPQVCADVQGFRSDGSFAFRTHRVGLELTATYQSGVGGVPDGVDATGSVLVEALINELKSRYGVTHGNSSDSSTSSGAKNWTPVSFYGDAGGYLDHEVAVDILLDARLGPGSFLSAGYRYLDMNQAPALDISASFFTLGQPGSLSVGGSAFANGVPLPHTFVCGEDDCTIGIDESTSFMVTAGFHDWDGFLAGGGAGVDALDTFSVTLTGPEGTQFTIVPEPSSLAMAALGLVALGAARRRA